MNLKRIGDQQGTQLPALFHAGGGGRTVTPENEEAAATRREGARGLSKFSV